ncbi:hypothetical protein O0I10_009756 [Lichtheimia ornata]|uniref:Uncharacterized protein n=1 Tax=Lichtheimia ornata TaxID=688661 RepID=A0AAD7XRX6_9FUNG|nr:uncharacterized protein O0I10_009756 [Lichtheimia ornata]KAJ8654574.1 hypothetical protein O0I10_009756 [Lichtheimia ornata]
MHAPLPTTKVDRSCYSQGPLHKRVLEELPKSMWIHLMGTCSAHAASKVDSFMPSFDRSSLGYERSGKCHQAVSELSLEFVKLMHAIFSHFKGANDALMDLFFEHGWCRDLGEKAWRSSKDGRTFHKRRESMDEKIAWNMFLTPRFDMFMYLADYMNMPGETGEIARGAILFALRLLDG